MTEVTDRGDSHVHDVVMKIARAMVAVPETLVEKILEHESAVQFDEKRFSAGAYIRNLVVEHLNDEEGLPQT